MYRFRIKEIMDQRGVSMGELSRKANIPINTVRKLVRNTPGYSPNMETLLKVARYLGVTLDELYEEVEDEQEKPEP